MPDHHDPPTMPGGRDSAEFERQLAEYLARIEGADSNALDEFRVRHPEFAERLGRQLEWLEHHLARARGGQPATIGPYRVQQLLGAGGMGDVWLCEQTSPFQRVVAVKVVKLDVNNGARLQRFAAEIQVLASLSHDGIARVFEAGSDEGRPYFAMEYVPGKPITDYCAAERLDLDERLRLFLDVCAAVEYAHRRGIIHRDLKPQNILVHGPRTDPVAKVIDFGLAKVVHDRDGEEPRPHDIAGTPDYMSPEQVDDSQHRVLDTRTDVYSLGVVLYELLTGVLPLALGQLGKRDLQRLIRAIREQQPSSPSVRVDTSPASDATSPSACGAVSHKRLSRMLAGDLDSIVMKALAKDAERRYGGVAQFAEDIRRHLRHEPVSSRPHTRGYLLAKFVRRHHRGVVFTATLALLALASLCVIWALAVQSVRRLEAGNLFGLAMYVRELRARNATPPAARPENVEALQQWQRELETVIAQQGRLQAFVDSPEADAADTTDPDGWASGRYAQRVLRSTLRRTLELLALMTRPGAEHDRVRQRIDWAQRVKALTVDAHAAAWARVRDEVLADWGFELPPQTGLVPLGRDERTRLQEFAMPLPGAELPERAGGRWVIRERTCPVFVLLPGGDVVVGAHDDAGDPARYDPERGRFEDRPELVQLEPFFASEYEFTNGQWQLLDPGDPGRHPDPELSAPTLPVVELSISAMLHVVHAWGMRLPDRTEWEYFARGGTDSPRWCGDAAALQRYENVHDQALEAHRNAGGEGDAATWNDGFELAAPVGSFAAAHPFLMHDVLGNAAEIAMRNDDKGMSFDIRGGSWHESPRVARATRRTWWNGNPLPSIGFRPVISVQR